MDCAAEWAKCDCRCLFSPRTKDQILYNKHVGHMLRTKLATADEGGVIAGVGALDSPYLVDCCD